VWPNTRIGKLLQSTYQLSSAHKLMSKAYSSETRDNRVAEETIAEGADMAFGHKFGFGPHFCLFLAQLNNRWYVLAANSSHGPDNG
jgi:hypothetical protein